jgi:hypothetical protein
MQARCEFHPLAPSVQGTDIRGTLCKHGPHHVPLFRKGFAHFWTARLQIWQASLDTQVPWSCPVRKATGSVRVCAPRIRSPHLPFSLTWLVSSPNTVFPKVPLFAVRGWMFALRWWSALLRILEATIGRSTTSCRNTEWEPDLTYHAQKVFLYRILWVRRCLFWLARSAHSVERSFLQTHFSRLPHLHSKRHSARYDDLQARPAHERGIRHTSSSSRGAYVIFPEFTGSILICHYPTDFTSCE